MISLHFVTNISFSSLTVCLKKKIYKKLDKFRTSVNNLCLQIIFVKLCKIGELYQVGWLSKNFLQKQLVFSSFREERKINPVYLLSSFCEKVNLVQSGESLRLSRSFLSNTDNFSLYPCKIMQIHPSNIFKLRQF